MVCLGYCNFGIDDESNTDQLAEVWPPGWVFVTTEASGYSGAA